MSLESLYKSQHKVTKMLLNSHAKDRLAHAYLFEGEKGTPKKELAIDFAKLLYCEERDKPCNHCINCIRIDHLNHPNVILIEPDGNTLKKEQIMYLQKEYAKTNLEEGPKVYIIDQIDKMSVNAANSILKFIEEPEKNIYTLLITDHLYRILPTIISRCQVLNFQPIQLDIVKDKLIKSGVAKEVAMVCSHLTNDYDIALSISQEESLESIIKLVMNIGKSYVKNTEDFIVLYERSGVDLLNNKNNMRYFLDILILMLRDFQKMKNGNELINFIDQGFWMKEVIDLVQQQRIKNSTEEVLKTKVSLEYNANMMLLLDSLLIKLNKVV